MLWASTFLPMVVCVRTNLYKMAWYQNLSVGELYDLEKKSKVTYNLWDVVSARLVRDQRMCTMMSRMLDNVDPIRERKCSW